MRTWKDISAHLGSALFIHSRSSQEIDFVIWDSKRLCVKVDEPGALEIIADDGELGRVIA
jgi:hypothetical protein